MRLQLLSTGVSICLTVLLLPLYSSLVSGAHVSEYSAEVKSSGSCCDVLLTRLPGMVFRPSDDEYGKSINGYWLLNGRDLSPNCIVVPSSSEDVSVAVSILSAGHSLGIDGCKFAIKSGGHSPFAEGSNINNGVTIDLSNLNQIVVSDDQSTVSVGPGSRFGALYDELGFKDLTVVAGRDSQVGVGGLILGGGISFHSPRFGYACDNVMNYEIVLASGDTVNANDTNNPDLFRALKGGLNNFGVVTRFDLRAIPQKDIWGGTTALDISQRQNIFNFVLEFNNAETYDPYASIIVFLIYHHKMGWVAQYVLSYTDKIENPPVFEKLTALPSFQSSTRLRTIKDLTDEVGAALPPGQRAATGAFTFKNNLDFMEVLHQLEKDTVESVSDSVEGLLFGLVYQPQPRTIFEQANANSRSGNSLGFDDADADLVNAFAFALWQNEKDDEVMRAAVRSLAEKGVDEAKSREVWHRGIYMNYTAEWQDVIGSYGEKNVKGMIEVSKRYDPEQVFQAAVPGGFKLARQEASSGRPIRDEL